MKYLSTFPGQGTQYVGMLEDVDDTYLKLVSETVSYDLNQESNGLASSVDIQLSLLIKQVSIIDCLKKEGFESDIVAGHSIGAFAAAVSADVLSLEDAIKLVFHRAQSMETLYPKEFHYGMGVVVGITNQVLEKRLKEFQSSQTNQRRLFLSNINSETQVTISGKLADIDIFFDNLKEQEAVTTKLLNVPVPSHCQLMKPVVSELEKISRDITFHDASCTYLSNVTGLPLTSAEAIKKDLLENVCYPVLWDAMSDIALESGIDVMIELPTGNTLTKLMKQKAPHCRFIPVEQMTVEGTIYLLNKWRD